MSINVLLINPRFREWTPNIWVPLSLTYIGAILENEGHSVKIIDMNAEKVSDKDLQNRLRNNVDIVGITGMNTEYQKIVKIISLVREVLPDVKIVLGGPLATTLPKELLEQTPIDFVLIGEGEKTISRLVRSIENGTEISKIKGIAYKKDGHILFTEPASPINDLDSIPFPARHLLDMEKYIKDHFKSLGLIVEGYNKIRSTNLISSRGCPYACIYCFKGMWGYKWRARSAENIIAEMEHLSNDYDVNGFWFNDDTFVLSKRRVFELANIIKERDMDIVWYCNGRVNLMRKDLLKAMYESGCRGISYGIESGNQRILDLMKRKMTLDQVRKVVKWTKESGINVGGYFMIGMLDETKRTINETINFAKELDLDFYGFSLATPIHGTELYQKAMKKNLVKSDLSLKGWDFDINANLTKDCTDGDLLIFKNKIFIEFTLKKLFGRFYMLHPMFWKEIIKISLSLRNSKEIKEFTKNAYEIAKSYFK